jgi:hypothetical protein
MFGGIRKNGRAIIDVRQHPEQHMGIENGEAMMSLKEYMVREVEQLDERIRNSQGRTLNLPRHG